jgi:arylsulfatase A-like enzyme/cytochrome c-type biogenesis protein CcmH/NrfG
VKEVVIGPQRLFALIVFLAPFVTTIALASPTASSGKSDSKSPNIILITLDTTRADRMGFMGSKRGLTPNLDALAKQSSVFTHAYAQAPLTPTSHATILTGTYPQYHQVTGFGNALAADLPYLPQILLAHRYHTAAFVGSIVLEPNPPYAPGFDRGFETYDAGFHNEGPGQDRYSTVQRRGGEVVAHALAWLRKHPKGPFFIWIHVYDAHDPYDPPEPYKTHYKSEPYDGAIAYEDAAIGKLLAQLKLRGLYDGALMAVTADHGESLGAHGEDTHGIFLYDETIQVPLLIKMPLKMPVTAARAGTPAKRIENRVELTDILPTLLQEAGIDIPKEVQGASLLPLMKAQPASETPEAWRDRPAYAHSDYARIEFGWSLERSVRTGKYLYIDVPHRELYATEEDPKAAHNLASSSAAVADTLAGQLSSFEQRTTIQRKAPEAVLDPDAQEKLGALGYMASGKSASNGNSSDQVVDPKDKIEIANMVHRAEALQQDLHSEESIALLEQVIAKEPGLPLYSKLATWLMRAEDYQNAVPVLRKAVQMNPETSSIRFQLAKSLMGVADYDAAIPELEQLVAKVPNLVEAHSFLELAYSKKNRLSDAVKECQIVLQYDPEDYPSYLILGQSQALLGDPQQGLATLKKAVELQPEAPAAHAWMADIYDQLGQKAEAARERAEAERLRKE